MQDVLTEIHHLSPVFSKAPKPWCRTSGKKPGILSTQLPFNKDSLTRLLSLSPPLLLAVSVFTAVSPPVPACLYHSSALLLLHATETSDVLALVRLCEPTQISNIQLQRPPAQISNQ